MKQQTINYSDLPPPHTLIRHGNQLCALMFHFAGCEQSLTEIAEEQGYEYKIVKMEDDLDYDHPVMSAYTSGDGDAFEKWTPTPQEGWFYGMQADNEDGAFALFVRLKPAPRSEFMNAKELKS